MVQFMRGDNNGNSNMRIDYFSDNSEDCPLLRIFEVTSEECQNLMDVFYRLSRGELKEAAVQEAVGRDSATGCRLAAKTGKRDIGVVPADRDRFECILRPGTWDNIAGLVEPFCEDHRGYQWLDRSSGTALLLSPSGEW